MKITEALRIAQSAPDDASQYRAFLACGFTPLHLQTLLTGYLQQRLRGHRVVIQTGLFGDVAGSLERLADSALDNVSIVLEWQDLDPRLGFRSAGAWGPAETPDIVRAVQLSLQRIARAVDRLPPGTPVALSIPTLPMPPLFHTPGWQAGEMEWIIQAAVTEFAARLTSTGNVALLNPRRLEEESPINHRYDLKQDLATGLPYTLTHADRVASAFANLVAPPAPKKGLITDLDETLWRGIAGEIGPDRVSWDLASHSHLHGLYQKLLASFAEEGVLIGVASKNDPAVVHSAFERSDILLPAEKVFPVEAHWQPKSASVARILQTWNIGADSVVFIDDSAMELSEVASAHPDVECIRFPTEDPRAANLFLNRLRDIFGRARISGEDAIRLESVRRGAKFRHINDQGVSPEQFLMQADATITIEFGSRDARVLELVNKTNQFNLNGERRADAEWHRRTESTDSILAAIDYSDRFGPLGKIAVIAGRHSGETVQIDTWVMSCRAFSRRIEHQCLRAVFGRSGARQILFDFTATPKNGPIQEFFEAITGHRPTGSVSLSRGLFEQNCPPLYQKVEERSNSKSWTLSESA